MCMCMCMHVHVCVHVAVHHYSSHRHVISQRADTFEMIIILISPNSWKLMGSVLWQWTYQLSRKSFSSKSATGISRLFLSERLMGLTRGSLQDKGMSLLWLSLSLTAKLHWRESRHLWDDILISPNLSNGFCFMTVNRLQLSGKSFSSKSATQVSRIFLSERLMGLNMGSLQDKGMSFYGSLSLSLSLTLSLSLSLLPLPLLSPMAVSKIRVVLLWMLVMMAVQ